MAVVTGATRGIGAAVSRGLVIAGAEVYGLFRSNDAAADELRSSLGRSGAHMSTIKVDVTDAAAVATAFEAIATDHGRIDILVNCAGGARDGLLLRSGPERLDQAIALNLGAAMACAQQALRSMLKARYGRIVNISSVVAAIGNPGQTAYAAAKAGLEGFSRSLAREVGGRGITVNCVAPGLIDTGMTAELDAAARKRAVEATALGRPGTVEEVAHAVLFLSSEAAGYVTGTVLQVNGGMYM